MASKPTDSLAKTGDSDKVPITADRSGSFERAFASRLRAGEDHQPHSLTMAVAQSRRQRSRWGGNALLINVERTLYRHFKIFATEGREHHDISGVCPLSKPIPYLAIIRRDSSRCHVRISGKPCRVRSHRQQSALVTAVVATELCFCAAIRGAVVGTQWILQLQPNSAGCSRRSSTRARFAAKIGTSNRVDESNAIDEGVNAASREMHREGDPGGRELTWREPL